MNTADTVVIIGGSSGIGLAVAADIGDRAQIESLFDRVRAVSHLVVTAADLPYGPAVTLTDDQIMRAVRSKLTGPCWRPRSTARSKPWSGRWRWN